MIHNPVVEKNLLLYQKQMHTRLVATKRVKYFWQKRNEVKIKMQ